MEEIVCDDCKKSISNNNDLVVTTKYWFINIKTYHKSCYAEQLKLKSIGSFFVNQRPINSASYTIGLIAGSALLLTFLLLSFSIGVGTTNSIIFAAVMILLFLITIFPAILIRLYVYMKFENKLR